MDEPTMTTISTIAIRAANSTIVVAFLKSIGFISLRIDEMHPRMLEIGEDTNQTSALINIHDDLMRRLKSKEDQVEELLARADNLVTQQKPPDVVVYEAMAESLGTTWKELNRQLLMRGFLLEETLKFYTLAEKHAKITSDIRELIQATNDCLRMTNLNDYVGNVQKQINDQIDITAAAINNGADIITQIRLLGSMADNVERSQETADACLIIEKIMLKMAGEWEELEELWKIERSKLETQIDQSGTILAHIEEIASWLCNARAQLKVGRDLNSIYQQTLHQKNTLNGIVCSLESDHFNSELNGRGVHLQNEIENFIREIKMKKDALDNIQNFVTNAEAVLHQLDYMEADMRSANAAMAGELAPLARQKVGAVVDEGQKFLYLDNRVPKLISTVQYRLQQIEELSNERISAASMLVTNKLDGFEFWLRSVESFLISHNRMGSNFHDAYEFFSSYNKFVLKIIEKEAELNALASSHSHEFNEEQRKYFHETRKKFENLKKLVESRIQLGDNFLQVHKFARELEGSFDSLNALINSNRNFSNEKLITQMKSVFQLIEETLTQERFQGEKFIETALSVGSTDFDLNINEGIDSIKAILKEHEKRRVSITNKWKNWQIAKSQEKKFIQMWQDETVEIIRIMQEKLCNKSAITREREELKKKMDEVIRSLPFQRKKIQEATKISQQIESIEDYEKIEKMKRVQKEIEDNLMNLRKRIETTEELAIEEVSWHNILGENELCHVELKQRKIHFREVTRAPQLITCLTDANIDEGSRFEFAAKIYSQETPVIRWFKDGRDVRDNTDYRTSYINGVASLTIEETFVEDTAVYTIRVENGAGVAESSAKLVVKSRSESQNEEQSKPRVIRQLRNLSINEGQNAVLDCVLYGLPEPKVIWYKEEETIKESGRIKLLFEGDHCSLNISEAVLSDSGLYTVKASNICGETTTFCRLIVQPLAKLAPPQVSPKPRLLHRLPSFEPPLSNQIVKEGQRCMLQVRILGEPKPFVYWKFNDSPIHASEDFKVTDETNGWNRLIIENAQEKHAGMYTAIAENEVGEARCGATLVVELPQMSPLPETIQTTTPYSEGFWSDTALLASPTPPPIPKHRYRIEFDECTEKEVNEIGNKKRFFREFFLRTSAVEWRMQKLLWGRRFELAEVAEQKRVNIFTHIYILGYSITATAPEFIRPFQNEYIINEGERFKADCLMVGNPRPKVHWYFNDKIIDVNFKFCSLVNTGDTYSISFEPAVMDNTGIYKMTAENIRGKTESVFIVRVEPRSFVQSKPVSTEHVQISEEFGAYEYEQQIPSHRSLPKQCVDNEFDIYKERRQASKQPPHSTRLATPPPAKKQTLQHTQEQIFHEQYEIEESWRVAGRPPHFTQTLVSAVAACGDVAKFEGVVTGWPTPEVCWSKDGISISKQILPELHFSNIGGRVSLTFLSAQLEHAGKYMCTARNASGIATSSAQLVVRPKTVAPDFVRRLISEEVAEGERLKWTVQITGDPVPNVTWLRDGQVIPNCDEVRLIDEGNGLHSMIIMKVELADSGQFTCLAENIAGEARSTADLVVRPVGAGPGNYFHVTKVYML
ncbi:unnamed protein product [Dracunculus medinensis]|uniref:Titin n=1 Tax=Dracunculus medinensis TaxID=318479 RepID=A0A158Q5A5_DRAME|nr:unnamed protein product [Dracunculus medinensis]